MKKLILLGLFGIFFIDGICQDYPYNEVLDSPRQISFQNSSQPDSVRLKHLIQKANKFKFNRPDSGIYYATKAFELAQKIGDKNQELFAILFLSGSHSTLGNSVTAYRIVLEGLRKAEEYESDLLAGFYRNLGGILRDSQKFEESLEYNHKAKKAFYRVNRLVGLSTIYAELGVVHSELGNSDSAFYYGYRAIAFADSINSTVAKDVAYDRIGDSHMNIQNIDSALYYYKLSYSIRTEGRRNPFILQKIAQIYAKQGQPDSALFYAEKSLNRALSNRMFGDISESALFFTDFYEKSDPAKALQYYKLAVTYRDSLDTISKMTGFADLTNFDELLRRTELERANEEYQSKLRTYAFGGSILILLIIALFLYRNYRAKHKAQLQIEGAYNKLKSTQTQLIHAEKMASLGELTAGIAHEIQNPLNFVNNFSEVNGELIDEQLEEIEKGDLEEIKELAILLKENSSKINHHGKRADAIVKGMLAHSRTGKGEKVETDINQLADEYLRLSYHGLRAKDSSFNAEFKTDFDPNLPKVNVIPQDIGRVLLNLINNAFQACASHRDKSAPLNVRTEGDQNTSTERSRSAMELPNPLVAVSTKHTETGIQITITDNGPGIPDSIKDKIFQPFFTTKPTGQGTGLGLSLSYDIVKAHGGSISVESSHEHGTTFTLSLPLV